MADNKAINAIIAHASCDHERAISCMQEMQRKCPHAELHDIMCAVIVHRTYYVPEYIVTF